MSLPYPHPSSEAASAAMRGNRRRDTRPELRLRRRLHAAGLRYRVDHTVVAAGVRVRPDVVFTRARVAVFVDGCFFHCCPEHGTTPRANTDYWGPKLARNVRRDGRVDEALRANGWAVLRAWEHDDAGEIATRVALIVRSRSRVQVNAR